MPQPATPPKLAIDPEIGGRQANPSQLLRQRPHFVDCVGSPLQRSAAPAANPAPTAVLNDVGSCLPGVAFRTPPTQFCAIIDIRSGKQFASVRFRYRDHHACLLATPYFEPPHFQGLHIHNHPRPEAF